MRKDLLKLTKQVALLAEGVDRNTNNIGINQSFRVALLAEGVDRNRLIPGLWGCGDRSPSSRRAWIEINNVSGYKQSNQRRPPRGGRG